MIFIRARLAPGTTRLHNVNLMLNHRMQRWSNNKSTPSRARWQSKGQVYIVQAAVCVVYVILTRSCASVNLVLREYCYREQNVRIMQMYMGKDP